MFDCILIAKETGEFRRITYVSFMLPRKLVFTPKTRNRPIIDNFGNVIRVSRNENRKLL